MKVSFLTRLKRSWVEASLLLFCLLLLFLAPIGKDPDEARAVMMGMISLFVTKTFFAVLGFSVAHWIRLYVFPYLSLEMMIREHHWPGVNFVAIWYGVWIWAFAVGG
jgi:hypothetical protein